MPSCGRYSPIGIAARGGFMGYRAGISLGEVLNYCERQAVLTANRVFAPYGGTKRLNRNFRRLCVFSGGGQPVEMAVGGKLMTDDGVNP